MAMHDQPRAAGGREMVDRREAVPVRGRRFMRHQDVETLTGKLLHVIGKDRIAMPKRQAAAPFLDAWLREELIAVPVSGWFDRRSVVRSRVPDGRLEDARETGDPETADVGHAPAQIAGGMIAHQIVVGRFGLTIMVAEDPLDPPSGVPYGGEDVGHGRRAIEIAGKDQVTRRSGETGTDDRSEVAVRVAGEQDRHDESL